MVEKVSMRGVTWVGLGLLWSGCVSARPAVRATCNDASGPSLQIRPSPIDYPNVPMGQTASQPVTVTNRGHADATIECISLQSQGHRACGQGSARLQFSIFLKSLVLTPGQSLTFSLVYTPSGEIDGDVLNIDYAGCDPHQPLTASDRVSGTQAPPPAR